MTQSSYVPDDKAVAVDRLSELEAIIMLGDVDTRILDPYDIFIKLGGRPPTAMRQRVEQALDKLAARQNVPASPVSTPGLDAISALTTLLGRTRVGENTVAPSANTPHLDAISTPTTAPKKIEAPKNVPTPPTSTSKPDPSSTPTTALTPEVVRHPKKAPTTEASRVDYTVIATIAGKVATATADAAASYFRLREADSRAEASRAQEAAGKAESAAEKAGEKRDQLWVSVAKLVTEAGVAYVRSK